MSLSLFCQFCLHSQKCQQLSIQVFGIGFGGICTITENLSKSSRFILVYSPWIFYIILPIPIHEGNIQGHVQKLTFSIRDSKSKHVQKRMLTWQVLNQNWLCFFGVDFSLTVHSRGYNNGPIHLLARSGLCLSRFCNLISQ